MVAPVFANGCPRIAAAVAACACGFALGFGFNFSFGFALAAEPFLALFFLALTSRKICFDPRKNAEKPTFPNLRVGECNKGK
jgi:hypothetical protein